MKTPAKSTITVDVARGQALGQDVLRLEQVEHRVVLQPLASGQMEPMAKAR